MPSSNDLIANAIVLDETGDSHSSDTTGNVSSNTYPAFESYPDDWYIITPVADLVVAVEITCTEGDPFTPEVDIYKSSIAPSPPTDWTEVDDLGWYVYNNDAGPTARGVFLMEAGETYYLNVYIYKDTYDPVVANNAGSYDLVVEPADSPPNDNLGDAEEIIAGGAASGSTVDATIETQEYDAGFDNGTPSVWHKYTPLGPGTITFHIENLGGVWEQPSAIIYYSTDPNVTDFDDLTSDSADSVRSDDGIREYTDDLGGSLAPYDWTGYTFYFQIISNDDNGPSDTGSYRFTVQGPTEMECLDAEDYINGSSPTSSVVSGSVQETQVFDGATADPYRSWISDMHDTLVIPGSDIADGPGFYAVTIKCKNDTFGGNWAVGLRRNGLAMYPGMYIDDAEGSTAIANPATAMAGTTSDINDPNYIDTISALWRLPVHPDDEIGVVVALLAPEETGYSIDIEQICFQRVANATPAPIQDLLDVPEMPLDFPTHPTRGLFEQPTPTAEPTNERVAVWGQDMCVTDDGKVWVLFMQQAGSFVGGYKTGPILKMWDGSSWTLIDDDLAGYGIHRPYYGGGTWPNPNFHGPYGLTMDTDGTDLWMAWADAASFGTNPSNPPYHTGVQPNGVIRVFKYDVSTDTLSDVGPELYANHTLVTVRTEAGSYDCTPHLKLSPAGRPWVGFADWNDSAAAKYRGVYTVGRDRHGYVAKLNDDEDDWIIQQVPLPEWITSHPQAPPNGRLEDMDWDGALVVQAESNIGSSGTATVDTRHSESGVKETQSGASFPAPGESIVFTPPAGEWGFALTPAWTITGSGTGAYGAHVFRNGVYEYTANGISGTFTASSTQWGFPTEPRYAMEFNGTTDTIEFRVWRTGVVDAVWIDEIVMYPSWCQAQIDGGRGAMDVSWVEDAQYHVNLLFDNPEEPEYPRAVYGFISNDPALHPINDFGEATASHFFTYCEWVDDSDLVMTRIWESMLEDDLPESVGVRTRESSFDITLGHWQQGLSAYYDPDSGKSYMHACLGIHFGGGDVNTIIELTPSGPAMPSGVRDPHPVGIIGGGGYIGSDLDDGPGLTWGWDIHANSMAVDYRGNLWACWWNWGPYGAGEMVVAKKCDTGTGGWIIGGFDNLMQHECQYNGPGPTLRMSPDGTKLYVFMEAWMWDDPTYFRWTTLGVWELDVVEDQWIPLVEAGGAIDFAKLRFRAFYIGDVD